MPRAHATGRVLAEAQYSTFNVPSVDNTSMDGYAVRAADCAAAKRGCRVSQRIPAGTVREPLARGTAARIFTGAPIPPGADAVVMQERCTAGRRHGVVRHRPEAGRVGAPRGRGHPRGQPRYLRRA